MVLKKLVMGRTMHPSWKINAQLKRVMGAWSHADVGNPRPEARILEIRQIAAAMMPSQEG